MKEDKDRVRKGGTGGLNQNSHYLRGYDGWKDDSKGSGGTELTLDLKGYSRGEDFVIHDTFGDGVK